MTESTPVRPFEFEVVATDGAARAGVFHTPHGDIPTPVFAPVGTQGAPQWMTILEKTGNRVVERRTIPVQFVPFTRGPGR